MKPSLQSVFAVLLTFAAAGAARGAEVVTLRSGFTLRCTSSENISPTTVRLHMPSAAGADNYMDVARSSIAGVETAPPEPVKIVAPPAEATTGTTTEHLLATYGARHNVNVALLASVVQAESGGNPHAVSRTGARGLMQLMPGTAAGLGVANAFEPEANVNGGSAYLDRLLTRYHDNMALALAAYNAGPAAVDHYRGIPPYRETRMYVARVIREFNRRVAARASATAASAVR